MKPTGRRQPFRQGDLDGLCGAYAVINAIAALCPELDQDGGVWLFGQLLQSLRRSEADVSHSVIEGVGQRAMTMLIRQAILHMASEYDINLTCQRLPTHLRRTTNLAQFWNILLARVSSNCVVMLGTAGRHCHWTVVVGVTPRQLRLFDSTDMHVIRRCDSTIGKAITKIGISLPHVFFVNRTS